MRTLNVLFIADIVAEPGVQAVEKNLENILHEHSIDLCIANGENAWDGKSISNDILQRLRKSGVDIFTGGNHTWDRYQIHGLLKSEPGLIRPLNYPPGLSGKGWTSQMISGFPPIVVMNIQGRVFMQSIDCPFRGMDRELERVNNEFAGRTKAPIIIVDFHAEASAEKMAMAWHLDGRVSALFGTHTHVQTADEQIFPKGMGFISDAGMTGSHESVIGMKKEIALHRFLLQTPHRYEAAKEDVRIQAVAVKIDPKSHQTISIERVNLPDFKRKQ
jgi:2',3'-cyclic-nucleotide 2'-phosphodiesterase